MEKVAHASPTDEPTRRHGRWPFRRRRHPQTLARTVAESLGGLAFVCTGFLVGFTFFGGHAAPTEAPASAQVRTDEATAEDLVEKLIERFDCWSGPAPADMEGQVPGHVIVTHPGDDRPIRGGDVLVGKALDQLFAGVDNHLQVHAFCR
ncbi:hypothetical protein ASG90_09615 [Nocardioides sp. Soil797]|nr:hypothetical protein ASG90_09615 [Nocardioides sp. Soil797]